MKFKLTVVGLVFSALIIMVTDAGNGLKIALHAQSRYDSHGWVAGSEITTSGSDILRLFQLIVSWNAQTHHALLFSFFLIIIYIRDVGCSEAPPGYFKSRGQ